MTNEGLITHLKNDTRVLKGVRLEEAFRAVDRKYFVPKELQEEAYEDYPLPIGHGATISQPTTVAFMLEKLDAQEGQKVLDIGSGSGWTTALLAHLVGPKGKVIGLEIVPELVELGQNNLRNCYSDVLKNNSITPAKETRAEIRQAKKGVIGLSEEAPFDRILVSAAAEKIPQEFLQQLKPGGVIVIPVGGAYEIQKVVRIRKKPNGTLETEEYPGFAFVPLR